MALEKVKIERTGKTPIVALFNPTQYSLESSSQYAEIGIPGLGAPILQYVRGNPRLLTMDLFFDTYEARTSVRDHTVKVYDLLAIDRTKHVPPVCTVRWGGFSIDCVLERVSGKFTFFLADGTPVRATLTVTFKEIVDVKVQVRKTPVESADLNKTRIVKRGDTLSGIAAAEYGDPAQWRPLAAANGIDNPRRLEPGQVLAIPPLP